jgi:hypothetical protein
MMWSEEKEKAKKLALKKAMSVWSQREGGLGNGI